MASSEFCTNHSSMNTDRKTANAVSGKTARACDSCLRKRARWYCTADDAFLCQACDSLVHSANQLASRHERVRLKTASSKQLPELKTLDNDAAPSWQYGFTRKARTPRHPKPAKKDKETTQNGFPLVPEIGNEDSMFDEETEAQLLYRVPVFDPFAAELCNVSNETQNIVRDYRADDHLFPQSGADEACDLPNVHVLLPSDMELEEFAADVETLLGTRFDEESCGIEGLGLTDCKQERKIDDYNYEENTVKVEDEEVQAAIIACQFDSGLDMSRETLDWNFNYDESPLTGEDEAEEEKVVVPAETMEMMSGESKKTNVERKKLLRLNYEEVILAWDNHGCPWTSGIRPDIDPNDCWLDFMGAPPDGARYPNTGGSYIDDGREARVTRYREKRRRRLFSKKIRYEVRKLNAEKRPRMKGRFVKRTSFAGESLYTIPS